MFLCLCGTQFYDCTSNISTSLFMFFLFFVSRPLRLAPHAVCCDVSNTRGHGVPFQTALQSMKSFAVVLKNLIISSAGDINLFSKILKMKGRAVVVVFYLILAETNSLITSW